MHVKSKMKRKCSTANAASMNGRRRQRKHAKATSKWFRSHNFFSSDMQCSEGVPVVFQNCCKNPRLRKKNCTYLRLERIYILSVARAGATTAAKEAAEEVPLTSCAIRAFLKRLNVWRDQKRRTDLLCICSHVWSDLFLFTITRRNRKWCRSARIALHPHEAWRTMSNVGRRWGC